MESQRQRIGESGSSVVNPKTFLMEEFPCMGFEPLRLMLWRCTIDAVEP